MVWAVLLSRHYACVITMCDATQLRSEKSLSQLKGKQGFLIWGAPMIVAVVQWVEKLSRDC